MKEIFDKIQDIYKLGYSFTEPGLYCIRSDKKGFDEYRFYEGKWIDNWPKGVEFIFDDGPKEDFLIGGLHWRLVSEQVRKVFVQNNVKGVQFLPVRVIHNQTSQDLGVYWVLNVIQSVEKLDWKNFHDLDCFRMSGMIFISDRLKRQLEIAQVTNGAGFDRIPPKTLGIEELSE